jgi:phospholipid/cholesterol/gamma-HCH transport system substrate-binding protein
MDAADVIHGDFANVVFKMQFKLTPVSEGGLVPTTLDDLITLCEAIPTAPICAPGGEAVTQLCTALPSLPLCSETLAATAAQPGSSTTPALPDVLNPSPAPSGGGGGSGGSSLDQLFGGLLGGSG